MSLTIASAIATATSRASQWVTTAADDSAADSAARQASKVARHDYRIGATVNVDSLAEVKRLAYGLASRALATMSPDDLATSTAVNADIRASRTARVLAAFPNGMAAPTWQGCAIPSQDSDAIRIESTLETADSDDDATITEAITYGDVVETLSDDSVTVSVTATLRTGDSGSATGIGSGSATGELADYAVIVRQAKRAAGKAAYAARSLARENMSVIGLDSGSESFGVTADDYATLRAYVSRRVFGNAGYGKGRQSASAYVRAGMAATGMPVAVDLVSDATSTAALIASKYARDGMPDALAVRIASATVGQSATDADATARKVMLGACARDGLRMMTKRHASKAASDLASYRSALSGIGADGMGRLSGEASAQPAMPAPITCKRSDLDSVAPRYSDLTTALTVTRQDGTLRYPTLFALHVLDSVQAVATSQGRNGGAGRKAVKVAAIAEWQSFTTVGPMVADVPALTDRNG